MGIDYKAVLVVGKYFDEASEVVDFLTSNGVLTQEETDDIASYGDSYIQELFYGEEGELYCTCLNAYSGDGYLLGYKLNVKDVDSFRWNVARAQEEWQVKFGSAPEILNAVKIY